MDPIFFEFWVMKTKLYNSFFINPNTLSFSLFTPFVSLPLICHIQPTHRFGLLTNGQHLTKCKLQYIESFALFI